MSRQVQNTKLKKKTTRPKAKLDATTIESKIEKLKRIIRKPNNHSQYMLPYCTQCNNTLKYDMKRKPAFCNKCNTLLKFKCKRCSKIFKTSDSLRSHLNCKCALIEPKFKCDQCPYKSYNSSNFKQHMNKWHLSRPKTENIFCDKCGKAFKIKKCLQTHMKNCSRSVKDPHFCKNCGKSYECLKNLKNHMKLCPSRKK